MAEATQTLTGFAAPADDTKDAAAEKVTAQEAADPSEYTFDVSNMDLFYGDFQALMNINMKIK